MEFIYKGKLLLKGNMHTQNYESSTCRNHYFSLPWRTNRKSKGQFQHISLIFLWNEEIFYKNSLTQQK